MRRGHHSWREMTANEKAVLARLLSVPFAGRDDLAAQAETAVVSRIDRNGSLQFRVREPLAAVTQRVPVEGLCKTTLAPHGAPAVGLLLHVVEGRLHELEVYTANGADTVGGPFEVDPLRIEVWAR